MAVRNTRYGFIVGAMAFFCVMPNTFAQRAPHDGATNAAIKFARDSTDVYLTIRPDMRKCVSPICGGWWVKAVNRNKMRCVDGTVSSECYVGTDKVNIPQLTDMQIAELRQAMSASQALLFASLSSDIPYGQLIINRAWLSATAQAAEGTFMNVKDNGMRCITYPCLNLDAEILNRNLVKALANYDLTAVGATDKQLVLAGEAIQGGDGLPTAGKFVEVTGPAGVAQGVVASQFFLPLVGEAIAFCRATGCSGQVCSDTDVMTSCDWRPEYACYATAMCTRQTNGNCGWVMDDALRSCLAKAATSTLLNLK